MVYTECQYRAAAHAASYNVRLFNIQCVQQTNALSNEMDPLYALDATTAPPILASVEENAFKFFWKVVQKFYFFIDTKIGPLLHSGIEAAWCKHQYCWSGADYFVMGLYSV